MNVCRLVAWESTTQQRQELFHCDGHPAAVILGLILFLDVICCICSTAILCQLHIIVAAMSSLVLFRCDKRFQICQIDFFPARVMQEHSFMDVADPVPEIVQRLGPPPPWRCRKVQARGVKTPHSQHHYDDSRRFSHPRPPQEHEGEVHEQRVEERHQALSKEWLQRLRVDGVRARHPLGFVLGHDANLGLRPSAGRGAGVILNLA